MRSCSIFRDPIGWAEMIVGSRVRYLLMLGVSTVLGMTVVAALVFPANHMAVRIGLGAIGYVAALETPLFALRGLRALVILRAKQEALAN